METIQSNGSQTNRLMKRQYELLALDKENVPVRIATITENSKPKAKATGQRLAKALGQRFHDIKLIKE
jgi:alpha-mannosidase